MEIQQTHNEVTALHLGFTKPRSIGNADNNTVYSIYSVSQNLYPHIPTNFGRFILIFDQMVFIFLQVHIVFTISSF